MNALWTAIHQSVIERVAYQFKRLIDCLEENAYISGNRYIEQLNRKISSWQPMADYSYSANANLVLQADRSSQSKRDKEPTGEAESLWGKIGTFGDRAQRTSADLKKRKIDSVDKSQLKKRKESSYAFSNILQATQDFGTVYRPKTKETKETYELILSFLQKYLGDTPQEVLVSAADVTIETLKASDKKDFDKKAEIEELLSADIESEQFAILSSLGKKITDFDDAENNLGAGGDAEAGVAVVFDDEDQNSDQFEVYDENEEDEGQASADDVQQGLGVDDGVSILASKNIKSTNVGKVSPRDVDVFWHQRLISSNFADVHIAQAKSVEAMTILESSSNVREIENSLMELFDYEHFDLVKALTINRDVIVWCTKLAKVDTAEGKASIRQEMKVCDLEWILQSLDHVDRKEDGENNETDEKEMDVDQIERAEAALPKASVDLEALIFEQGGHLMTNKKCKLPEGSFKNVKKGYEEVHIPPPKARPMKVDEELVKIAELPEWAQNGFVGAKSLNRIQSHVYPTAFGEDSNLLLCAPTGAGKYSFLI